MENGFFIGRDRELETFIAELSEGDQFKDPSRIFYLRAESGMGKRAFYAQLWKNLRNSPLDFVWVRPASWHQLNRPEEWPELLTVSTDANAKTLRQRIEAFRRSALEGARRVPAGGGGSQGADPRMEGWMEAFAQVLLGRKSLGIRAERNLRVVFVLDHYDRLSQAKKQWFSRSVFEPLVTAIPELDVRFLLSGEQSFYQTMDLEHYWVPFQTEVREVDLPPLSPHETQEFARRAKVLVPEGFDLHEASGGVPARIRDVLQGGGGVGAKKGADLRKVQEVEALFAVLGEEERNWILGAVHLQLFDEEGLKIFGTAAGARKALKWLRKQQEVKVEQVGEYYRVAPSWADAILRWQEQYHPEQYRKLAARVQSFQEVCQHIPEQEHREKLARLSVLNFFNPELLEKLYGEEASSLNAFVRMHLEYFIKTPFNYQVSMPYQPFVQNYVRLIPQEDKERLREKAAYLWEKARTVAREEAAQIEQKLSKEQRSHRETHTKLDPILSQINQRNRIRQRKRSRGAMPAKPQPQQASGEARQPKAVCWFFNAMGLLLLFIGLVPTAPVDWNYVVLGLLFVVLGVFWPASEEAASPVPPRHELRSTEDGKAEEDTLVSMLNLKRVGLENRTSYLSMQIAHYQRRLRELDGILGEPYLK